MSEFSDEQCNVCGSENFSPCLSDATIEHDDCSFECLGCGEIVGGRCIQFISLAFTSESVARSVHFLGPSLDALIGSIIRNHAMAEYYYLGLLPDELKTQVEKPNFYRYLKAVESAIKAGGIPNNKVCDALKRFAGLYWTVNSKRVALAHGQLYVRNSWLTTVSSVTGAEKTMGEGDEPVRYLIRYESRSGPVEVELTEARLEAINDSYKEMVRLVTNVIPMLLDLAKQEESGR